MAFSSLIFVFGFLPAFLLLYWLVKGVKGRNLVLLGFSLLFYAFGGLRYLILLLVMTLVGWASGLVIDELQSTSAKKKALAGTATLYLLVLGIFKYAGFVLGSLDQVLSFDVPVIRLALPLGISFYVFKLISYSADVYHGRVRSEISYGKLLLYTGCFHHVMQGPILRYGELQPALKNRAMTKVSMARGIYRFSIGLGKKVILADHCGALADTLAPMSAELAAQPALSLWAGMLFYTLQIYLDFSAYTDMAIGLGRMLGFRYPENFDYPYIADSVRDFWRRWHKTLSSFFRDYVYIPLGGNRVGKGKLLRNLLVVWLLTGIWHGASWNFILWGLYYFVFVTIEQLAGIGAKKDEEPGVFVKLLGHIYAGIVFYFGWILFRYSDFSQLLAVLRGMFLANGNALSDPSLGMTLLNNLFFTVYAILACTPVFAMLEKKFAAVLTERELPIGILYGCQTFVVVLLITWSALGMAGSTYTPFLYNQF